MSTQVWGRRRPIILRGIPAPPDPQTPPRIILVPRADESWAWSAGPAWIARPRNDPVAPETPPRILVMPFRDAMELALVRAHLPIIRASHVTPPPPFRVRCDPARAQWLATPGPDPTLSKWSIT